MNDPIEVTKHRFLRPKIVHVLTVLVAIVLIGLYASVNIHVDQVIIEPGSADSVSESIEYKDVATYEPNGTIRFLTVYVSAEKPTLLEYWRARYLRDDVEFYPWKDVNGDQTPQESEELNRALMLQSQNAATVVALNALGCDVSQEGTGAIVAQIEKDSPAAEHLEVGDVITAIAGSPVVLNSDASAIIRSYKAGDSVSVTVERGANKKVKTFDVELASSPYEENTAFLGVATVTRDQQFNFPVSISIDPGAVSGPSAGVAFALSIIDELTQGELTGGKDIAATGEISLDGKINPVGGVKQKAIAAREAGAQIMLVPPGEGKDARSRAGSMKVYEVSDISQALEILKDSGGDPLPQVQSCPTS